MTGPARVNQDSTRLAAGNILTLPACLVCMLILIPPLTNLYNNLPVCPLYLDGNPSVRIYEMPCHPLPTNIPLLFRLTLLTHTPLLNGAVAKVGWRVCWSYKVTRSINDMT